MLQFSGTRPPARWLVVVLVVALAGVAGLANHWARRELESARPSLESGAPGFTVEEWVDRSGQYELPDALRTAAFTPFHPPQAGRLDPCVWYRLTIANDSGRERRAILGVSNDFMQEGALYTPDGSGGFSVQRTGAVVKWQDRAVPGSRPAFALSLPAHQVRRFYLRIADTMKQPHGFLLWNDEPSYRTILRLYSAEQIGYFSLWIGLFAYNGFLYAVLRRADYLRYVLYLLSIGALFLAASDLTTLVAPWPHWPLRAIVITALLNGMTFSLIQFSRSFLDTAVRSVPLDRWLGRVGWVVLGLTLAAPAWLWPRRAATYEAVDFGANILVLTGLPVIGAALGLRRTPQAWLYVLAFLPTVAGAVYVLCDNVGLPDARTNGMPFLSANALELVFLSLALAWRYRRITDEAQTVSREYTVRLEENVERRTRQLRESNEQLARANRDKERVLAIIGHDLRGPANMLHMMADALGDDLHHLPPEDSAALATGIKEACQAQLELLDNLLQWGRIQAGNSAEPPRAQPVAEVVLIATSTLAPLARTKGVALTSDIPAGLMVSAAQQGAQTIVRNVIGNALKFTPSGGSIDVSARSLDRTVEITVRDTGVGMTKNRLAELLSGPVQSAPGTQAEKGAGIGLTLCRDLARASGGDLLITSELGRGTTVLVSLPAV